MVTLAMAASLAGAAGRVVEIRPGHPLILRAGVTRGGFSGLLQENGRRRRE